MQPELADKNLFALPDYRPAIGDQQSAQVSTSAVRRAVTPQTLGSDLEYDAYKLSQLALGKKPVSKSSWQMMYRHDLMMSDLLPGV